MLLSVTIQYQGRFRGMERLDPPTREEVHEYLYKELLPPGSELVINGKGLMINTVLIMNEQLDDPSYES